jgi:hypothetical protein
MAAEAGRLVTSDASVHITAMETLVGSYIRDREGEDQVDWDFIAKRNMETKDRWKADDANRHRAALADLEARGYEPTEEGDDSEAGAIAEVVAELEPTSDQVGEARESLTLRDDSPERAE